MRETKHLSAADLEAYVLGALPADRVAEIEAHLTACEACAEAMCHEASLELALGVLAEELPPEPVVIPMPALAAGERLGGRGARRARRATQVAVGVFGALALAASAVLWLGAPHGVPSAAGGPSLEAVDASGSLAAIPSSVAAADALDGG